jgi:hypothetical protein
MEVMVEVKVEVEEDVDDILICVEVAGEWGM